MNPDTTIDVINVINLCCLCLKETKLELISETHFEKIIYLTRMPINRSDIHQACPNCLKLLNETCAFCLEIANSLKGYIDLFQNIIESDEEITSQQGYVHDDSVSEIKDEPEYDAEFVMSHGSDTGVTIKADAPVVYTPEVCIKVLDVQETTDGITSFNADELIVKEIIKLETQEEKIRRIMADSDDETDYEVEFLEVKKVKPIVIRSSTLLECGVCRKAFTKNSALIVHARSHTNEKPFACSHCDKKFKSKLSVKEHESTHTGVYPMHCLYGCGRGFHSKKNKKNHEAVHTGDRPFACDICDKKYILKAALQDHYSCRHSSESVHTCDVCGKTFGIKSLLNSHLKTHSTERRFKCQQCPLAYKFSSHLHDHVKTHGDAQFICAMCDAKFWLKQSLRRHLRYHLGVRDYHCSIDSCTKSFVMQCDLKKHLRTHTGETFRFQCESCENSYANRDALKRHKLNHRITKKTLKL